MCKCPHCGGETRTAIVRTVPRSELEILVADSVDLAVPRYGELLAHYTNLIQDSSSPEKFFETVQSKANKEFLLSIGTGLYEGLAQAAMIGRRETISQRSTPSRRATPPNPPAKARGKQAPPGPPASRGELRAVTGYDGNPVELDWFRMQAFTVSGIEQQAVLQKLKDRIAQVVAGDSTWDDFRRTAQDELTAIGIEISDSRLETVFDTNLANAHGAGKWLEGQAAADILPYWMYETVGDSRVRPQHQAQSGKVYAKNHPYWNRWFPPNGYRCRCTVTEWDKRSLDRAGIKVESELPEDLPDSGFAGSPADVEGLLSRLISENKLSQYTAESYDLGPLRAAEAIGKQVFNFDRGLDVIADYEQLPRTVRQDDLTIPQGLVSGERMVLETIRDPQEVWGWNNRPQVYLKHFREDGKDYTAVVEVLGDVRSAKVVPGNGDEFRRGLLIKQ